MKVLSENKRPIVSPVMDTACKWSAWNDITEVGQGFKVIFNTYAQSAVLLRDEEFLPLDQLDEKQIEQFCHLGMIVPQSTDEHELVETQFAKGKKDLSYLDLTILLTRQCQLRCVYCFEGDKKDEALDDTTSDDILSFLERQLPTLKKLRVTWFGGEPLLAYSKLKSLSLRLLEFCDRHGVEYSADITTNGFALSEERCRELVNDLKVKRYIVTLDGPRDIHDQRRPMRSGLPTFQKIWKNINTLIEYGAMVLIRMTIDKANVKSIPTLLDEIAAGPFARKTGLSFCRTMDFDFTPDSVQDVIYTEKEFADIEWGLIQYAHQLRLWGYRFPHAAPSGGCLREGDIVIGTHGEIYKCLDTVGDQQWESGNIGEKTVLSRPEWYERWLNWTPSQSPGCRACVLQPLCNGGCPHNALFRDKKHGTSTQCPDWKANYKRQIVALARERIEKEQL